MNEEFYAVVKLVSGEEIFAIVMPTLENGLECLILADPIVITKVDTNAGYYAYKVEPWLKLTTESIFVLEKSRIITVVESFDQEMVFLYKRYINSNNSGPTGNYRLKRNEGYVNNVKDVRTQLEKIYQSQSS
jgi:hypothetical protein